MGESDPYNGNYIRLYHDLDGDGNFITTTYAATICTSLTTVSWSMKGRSSSLVIHLDMAAQLGLLGRRIYTLKCSALMWAGLLSIHLAAGSGRT